MGNLCTCFSPKTPVKNKKPTKRLQGNPQTAPNSSNRWTRIRSTRKDNHDELIHEQALAAAILFRQHQQQNGSASGSFPFDRSVSLRHPNGSGSKKTQLPRSSSSRARSLTDPLLQPHQLVNQVCFIGFLLVLVNSVFFVGLRCQLWELRILCLWGLRFFMIYTSCMVLNDFFHVLFVWCQVANHVLISCCNV
jgi:hypothetical protein